MKFKSVGARQELKIGLSPCPNDTFIFDALLNGKIETGGIDFIPVFADVEELNRKAVAGELEITKLSFFAYSKAFSFYQLLDAGSALGFGAGPLLVSRLVIPKQELSLRNLRIAIPGENTTANFLLSHFFPEATNKYPVVFSEIENEVLNGNADAGLIIHESRFTYQQRGLKKIIDLGELWESKTRMPLPLGGIAVKRTLPEFIKQKINSLIRKSVEFAFQNPESGMNFIKLHSAEMENDTIKKHIDLYVNNFSSALGEEGRNAVIFFLRKINPGILSAGKIFTDNPA